MLVWLALVAAQINEKCPYAAPQQCTAFEQVMIAASPGCPAHIVSKNLQATCNVTAGIGIPSDETTIRAYCDDGYITEIAWVSPSPLCVLNGTISPSIVDLQNITDIIITSDRADLSGTLPPDLHRLALHQLAISQPRMTGPIPAWNDSLKILSISPSFLQNTYLGKEFLKRIVQLDTFFISGVPPLSYWSSFVHFLDVPSHSLPPPNEIPNCPNLKCTEITADCDNACRMLLSLGIGDTGATYNATNSKLVIYSAQVNGTLQWESQINATQPIKLSSALVGTLWGPMPSSSNVNVQIPAQYYPIGSYLYNAQPNNLCDFTGHMFANMPGMMFNRTLTEDDVALIKSNAVVECAPSTDIVTNAATQATHLAPNAALQAAHLTPSYGNDQAAPAITVAVVSAALVVVRLM